MCFWYRYVAMYVVHAVMFNILFSVLSYFHDVRFTCMLLLLRLELRTLFTSVGDLLYFKLCKPGIYLTIWFSNFCHKVIETASFASLHVYLWIGGDDSN